MVHKNQVSIGASLLVLVFIAGARANTLFADKDTCSPAKTLSSEPVKTIASKYAGALVSVSAHLIYGANITDYGCTYLPLKFSDVKYSPKLGHISLQADCAQLNFKVTKHGGYEQRLDMIEIKLAKPNNEGLKSCTLEKMNLVTVLDQHLSVKNRKFPCVFEDYQEEHQTVFVQFDLFEFEVNRPDGSPRDKFVTRAQYDGPF